MLIIAQWSYKRGVQLKRKLKCTQQTGVVAVWLLHCDQYMRQYYSVIIETFK